MNALLAAGFLVNSALYLAGCFVAGIVVGAPLAWMFALAAVGVCASAYMLQLLEMPRPICIAVTVISWLLGVASGVALLVRLAR